MVMLVLGAPAQSDAQTLPLPPRLSLPKVQYYANHQSEWQQVVRPRSPVAPLQLPTGPWQSLTHGYPALQATNPLLLTDGTVIVNEACSQTWYKLTPDNTGSYVNGSWSQIASLPSGYGPIYFASAVLPDGRVIINGGEYNISNNCNPAVHTALGAIYDPVADTWTSVSSPSGWSTIGDAQSVVLTDGTYMLANCCTKQSALLNATTLTWTATGAGKFDSNNEEGWTLLPNGKVLTVDAYVSTGMCAENTEIYDPSSGTWSSAGNTASQLADCGSPNLSFEMGPQVLRPDGTVVAFGAVTSGAIVATAIYSSSGGTWSAGPNLLSTCGANGTTACNLADAPAALLPNGNILFAAGGGLFNPPTSYFELSYGTNVIKSVPAPPTASSDPPFAVNFLVLPTGQVLSTDFSSVIEIYTPADQMFQTSWQPVISSVASRLAPGSTYTLSGTQLGGLSQGASYGDDVQGSTNFPLVKIVNSATGHVFFARTTNWTVSVAANAPGSTSFKVPANMEAGASTLYVVANGIPSAGTPVCISRVNSHDFSGDCMSDVLWYNNSTGQVVNWLLNGTNVIGGGSLGSAPSWSAVGQRDFNGDGNADILWRNATTGQTVVWLVNGANVIGGGSPGSAASPWIVAGTGDFNGDGLGDILWYNTSTGQVVLWFLNGANLIGGGSPGLAPSPWTVAGTGDFNGDNKTDILWYNPATGQVVVWLLNGASLIGGGSPGSAASPWIVAGTGDFNGDGRSDLLWYNGTSGQLVIWLLDGTSVIGGGSPGSATSPWTVAETGDFNGDGKSDILWSNSTSGQLVVWLLNGTSVIGGGSPGSAATPWMIQGRNAD
jgi:hypothetical protein